MEPTVIRSSSPFEVLALAERTLGFRPRESLLVVSLRPPRWRSGLVARADLADAPQALDTLAEHLRADGAGRAFVAVVTDEGDLPLADPPQAAAGRVVPAPRPAGGGRSPSDRLTRLPGADLARRAADALQAAGVRPELWLLHRGRLLSLDCDRACCPPEGLPLERVDDTQVAAEMVLAGRGLARDREEWQAAQLAAVAPAGPALVAEVSAQLEVVAARWRRWEREQRAARAWAPGRRGAGAGERPAAGPDDDPAVAALALWRGLLEAGGSGPTAGAVLAAGPEVAAVLLDSLERLPVRDLVLGAVVPEALPPCPRGCAPHGPGRRGCALCAWPSRTPDAPAGADRSGAAVGVLQDLATLAAPGRRAPALGGAAYVLWSRGASAPAGLLAEEALADDPRHSLSQLVLQSVHLGVAPPSVRGARSAG